MEKSAATTSAEFISSNITNTSPLTPQVGKLKPEKKKLDRLCFFSFWTGSLSFSLIMEALYSEMIRVH